MNYLIIGAGPSGLAMARALKHAHIAYEQVEADTQLGGNWYHGVYKSVFTDASKDVMQFKDFPMPAHYPDFLSQELMLEYLNHYADHFDLRSVIKFSTKVIWIEAIEDNQWKVHFGDKSTVIYKGVIICNGHHWDMKHPELSGDFSGKYIHAKQYKDPDQLRDKKVLIIGSGNSAADIACESARVGKKSVMSFIDTPWIFPKSFMGVPLGRNKFKRSPKFLLPLLIKILIRLTFGRHSDYGLEVPRHKPFEKHPTVSEELPYYLKHGRIMVKNRVAKVSGSTVWFEDGTIDEFDMIVGATGYQLSFPFLPESLARVEGKHLRCIGHCVYPDYKGLFFLGWQQVRGGVGELASLFAEVIVDFIQIEDEYELPSGKVLESMNHKLSSTHLYGAVDIYNWIDKHSYASMSRRAKALRKNHQHENIPTKERKPSDTTSMKVY